MTPTARILLALLASVALLAAALLGYTAVRVLTTDPSSGGAAVGEASIGGPFTLVDGEGRVRTDAEFRGKLMLVYFGYTFCPDVCPTELQSMAQAVELLGPDAEKVQPVFITIDPERDTPEAVKAYAASFGNTVGLTGTPEQIGEAARAYRVYYRKASSGSATEYLMDHSSIIYLMDGQGRFIRHFSRGSKPETMAAAIRKFI